MEAFTGRSMHLRIVLIPERFQAKWKPVRVKKKRQIKK